MTKYPLLLSRLLKVTPTHHEDRASLQESRERIEHALEHMNQETRGDTGGTKLWRRISAPLKLTAEEHACIMLLHMDNYRCTELHLNGLHVRNGVKLKSCLIVYNINN